MRAISAVVELLVGGPTWCTMKRIWLNLSVVTCRVNDDIAQHFVLPTSSRLITTHRIAYNTKRCISHSKFVRLSVRLSVIHTLALCRESRTGIMRSSPADSTVTVVFCQGSACRGNTPIDSVKWQLATENCAFGIYVGVSLKRWETGPLSTDFRAGNDLCRLLAPRIPSWPLWLLDEPLWPPHYYRLPSGHTALGPKRPRGHYIIVAYAWPFNFY